MTETSIAERYTAVWNEPDPDRRREAVAQLWAEDGSEFTDTSRYTGHGALEARIAGAYEQFIAPGEFVFVLEPGVVGHHGAVTFTTHMVPAAGGGPAWTGVVFLLLGEDGRITRDYQFSGADAGTRAVVTEFLRRLSEGSPERIAELFADVVDWQLAWPSTGHPAVPWIRARSTRADVADHFRALDSFHVPERRGGREPEVLVQGADAVVLGEIRQTVRRTGRSYRALCALRLTVTAGLITRYHVYEDSLSVAQALAAEPDTPRHPPTG
ncbi:nuclear transport factor 2 family protein [Amycolatopsis thermoflava]|uniref:nuclear transport factor 2 family protein n=1 Tax=Amycolatopsis thermoflava TaxID=84480 RepID=UPI003655AF15